MPEPARPPAPSADPDEARRWDRAAALMSRGAIICTRRGQVPTDADLDAVEEDAELLRARRMQPVPEGLRPRRPPPP